MRSNFSLKSSPGANRQIFRIHPYFNHNLPHPLISGWLVAQTWINLPVYSLTPLHFFLHTAAWVILLKTYIIMPLFCSNPPGASHMPYSKNSHLYWPPELDNHQFHHSLWPQLWAPFLFLIPLPPLGRVFSDTQSAVLPWDSAHPSPGMFVSHLHLDFFLLRLQGLCTNLALSMGLASPSPIFSNLLSRYIFSKPLSPSDMPYILLVHLFVVCVTPLECRYQKSRDLCSFHSCFIPECQPSTRNMVSIH